MHVLIILLLLSGTLYFCLIVWLALGWMRMPEYRPPESSNKGPGIFASIVIAARNEEENIARCLHDLLNQQFPVSNFEIIVVDDHSEDHTAEVIKDIQQEHNNVRLISLSSLSEPLSGKKAAIAAGVSQARHELIITTDADCLIPEYWLSAIATYFQQHRPIMISAPVTFTPQKGLFGKFAELEFISLVASGGAALGLKKPLMCNGANLAFKKSVFFETKALAGNNAWASGDDMFLMHAIAKKYGSQSIHFLKSSTAIIQTQAPSSFKNFIIQRIRWGSKTKAYLNTFTALVAAVVFLNSFLLLVSTGLMVFNFSLVLAVIVGWTLKICSDSLLLFQACKFFGRRKLTSWILPFAILHAVYISFTGILSTFSGFKWKGRSY